MKALAETNDYPDGPAQGFRRWPSPPMALAALAAAFLLLGASGAFAAFGELVVLQGQATVIRGRITAVVIDRLLLEHGDRVITAKASRAHIRLLGPLAGSEALVSENTEIRVADLAVAADRSPFDLVTGAIRARLLEFVRSVPAMITTVAVVGIKGTDFIVWVKRREASEFVGIDGVIEAVSRSRPEYAIRIGPRQWGEIVEGERPRPPIRVPDEIWEAAQAEFAFPGESGFGLPDSP